MNLPMMPGHKSIGAKAATVVSVLAATAPPTSSTASFVASHRSWPSSR